MTTYREAGVDIEAGEEMVKRIKSLVRQTFIPGVLADIGSFGAFFELDVGAFQHPVMVSSVDGVGTKLKVAFRVGEHHTVGQDLVNHCVNDIAVCGAKPLYFMDYFSTGKLYPDVAEQVVSGFAKACLENGCALVGGETAEMPDIYQEGEYDLAGMIVGVVEKHAILDGNRVQADDLMIGLPSTGLHTNGYSLARKVLFEHFEVTDRPEELGGKTVGEALLQIHRSYLDSIQAMIQAQTVHALVHVTGGGIPGNTKRVIPDGLGFVVDYEAWTPPALFKLIQTLGSVPDEDMRRTFNMGIGLIAIIPSESKDQVFSLLKTKGESPVMMGHIERLD